MGAQADIVYDVDYCVIGSGCSGLVSAARAAELGLKVVVLEAYPTPGGSFFGTEAHYYLNGRAIEGSGIKAFSEKDALKQHLGFNNYSCDGRVTSAFMQKHGQAIDWMLDQGVEVDCILTGEGGIGENGGVTGIMFKGKARGAFKYIKDAADKNGVEILCKTRAKQLIKEDGVVKGVIAVQNWDEDEAEQKTVQVNAKATLIATGGFAHNDEMVKKYIKADADGMRHITIMNGIQQGDGINMAWDAGAAEMGSRFVNGATGTVVGHRADDPVDRASVQPFLWVNRHAKRFCDEQPPEQHFEFAMTVEQPHAEYFTILDTKLAKKMMVEPTIRWNKLLPRHNNPEPELLKMLDECAGDGSVFKADTIEELAEKCGLDPVQLKETWESYNKACADKFDPVFFKDEEALVAIDEPPFYAILVHAFLFCTLGGIKINEFTQALDSEGKVIPGLYASGNDAGGFYGNHYNYYDSGSCSAFAFFTGWEAANVVAKALKG